MYLNYSSSRFIDNPYEQKSTDRDAVVLHPCNHASFRQLTEFNWKSVKSADIWFMSSI